MREYTVQWEIQVDGENPCDAAKAAWAILRSKGSTANVFTVIDEDGEGHHVDLLEDAEGSITTEEEGT